MGDWLIDGPEAAAGTVALAHGAGAAMDTPFMAAVARGLAGRGLRVVRFELAYMAARREDGRRRAPPRPPVLMDEWREAVSAARARWPGPLVIGGKSLGGRIASMVADELGVDGLVVFGYPFHPPGRPERPRVEHLAALATPTLILQGERDAFGLPGEVAGYVLPPSIRVAWLPDGDHSFRPRKRSGHTEAENLDRAVEEAGDFVTALIEPVAPR